MSASLRSSSHPLRHIVIIGGGITGVTSAYALIQQGWHSPKSVDI
jgi:glycine/D-amino acid oxidase-like deaminating enzyme